MPPGSGGWCRIPEPGRARSLLPDGEGRRNCLSSRVSGGWRAVSSGCRGLRPRAVLRGLVQYAGEVFGPLVAFGFLGAEVAEPAPVPPADIALSCPRFRGVPEARLMILARRRTTSSASTT